MYKFVREFKKPIKNNNPPPRTSNSKLTTTITNTTKPTTSPSVQPKSQIDLNVQKAQNDANGALIKASSNVTSTTSPVYNRKSVSANDTNRQPFLKIKSNHSFNRKDGIFIENSSKFSVFYCF